jgi:hypothetical protein
MRNRCDKTQSRVGAQAGHDVACMRVRNGERCHAVFGRATEYANFRISGNPGQRLGVDAGADCDPDQVSVYRRRSIHHGR